MRRDTLPPPSLPLRFLTAACLISTCICLTGCIDDPEPFEEEARQDVVVRQQALGDRETWVADEYSLSDYPPAPPTVPEPVYECARKVSVISCIPNAEVELFIDGSVLPDTATCEGDGSATFDLSYGLERNDQLRARQTLIDPQTNNSVQSDLSSVRVVTSYPGEALPKADFRYSMWQCGKRVPAKGVLPGAQLILFENGVEIDTDWPTEKWGEGYWPMWVDQSGGLIEDREMSVQQVYCPDESNEIEGPISDAETVHTSPNPMPEIDNAEAYDGQRAMKIHGTYFSSRNDYLEYEQGAVRDKMGFFYAAWEKFRMNSSRRDEPLDPSEYTYTATQKLCPGSESDPIEAVRVIPSVIKSELDEIDIIEPICPLSNAIRVKTSSSDAKIIVTSSPTSGNSVDAIQMQTTANPGIMTIEVPDGKISEQDSITVRQIAEGNDGNIVGDSDMAPVNPNDGLDVLGAKSHTDYATGQTTKGFMRNGPAKSRGPRFEFNCCVECGCEGCEPADGDPHGLCLEDGEPRTVTVTIDYGSHVEEVTLTEELNGLFTGRADWYVEGNAPGSSGEFYARINESQCGNDIAKSFNILEYEPLSFTESLETHALWLWTGDLSLKGFLEPNSRQQEDFFDFIESPPGQPPRRINRIFFEGRSYSSNNDANANLEPRDILHDPLTNPHESQYHLRQFLQRAHDQGVAVEYLDGLAAWVIDEDDDPGAAALFDRATQVCEDVVAFNETTANIDERFDGINFDIEPHKLGNVGDGWNTGNGYNLDWIKNWTLILRSCRDTIDGYASRTGHPMTLSTHVGDNYHYYVDELVARLNDDDPADDFCEDNGPDCCEPGANCDANGEVTPVDYVTVMNYLDHHSNDCGDSYFMGGVNLTGDCSDEEAFAGGVEPNLQDWSNVPVLFGLETISSHENCGLSHDHVPAENVTFRDDSLADLHGTIDQVFTNQVNTKTIGTAVHHYYECGYGDFNDTCSCEQ